MKKIAFVLCALSITTFAHPVAQQDGSAGTPRPTSIQPPPLTPQSTTTPVRSARGADPTDPNIQTPKHPNTVSLSCGVAEKRENDFYWENELFGMRAYGPGEFHKWSGLDVFNKAAQAEGSVQELLSDPGHRGNWHLKPWKGILDNYAVGAGRGCGGVALWGDGEWKTYPDWESCTILTNTADVVDFTLTYPAFSGMGKMTYHITLKKGDRFFRNTVTFEKPYRAGFRIGPGLDLSEGRNHKGTVWEDERLGLVALFEESRGDVEGSTATAVILDPKDAAAVEFKTDHLGCRILALKKNTFTYYAGAAWSKGAGNITTPEQWFETVRNFRKELEK